MQDDKMQDGDKFQSVIFQKFLTRFCVFATPYSNVDPFTQLQGTGRHYDVLPGLRCLRGNAFGF